MDSHVKDFYRPSSDDQSPRGHFHDVIPLHENTSIDWNSIHAKCPRLCRGWYELSQLNTLDRIEFCRDFWLTKIPYHPKLQEFLIKFFESLDNIGIYLVQQKFEDPYEPHQIYSLKGDRGFFKGMSPATESELRQLQQIFPEYILPADYQAFLQIHNGFSKTTDCTGIISSFQMKEKLKEFRELLSLEETLSTTKGDSVNPKALIPFYESFGMPFFQCFWGEWYPENEMGNVYYSGITKTISDIKGQDGPSEYMAFPTFTEWLMFYLEQIE